MKREQLESKALELWTADRLQKLTGNRNWLIHPANAAWLLYTIGMMNHDGAVSPERGRKLSQINHMLSLLKPWFDDLARRFPRVRIVDACCGTSSLSFLAAWYFREVLRHEVSILGIDRSPEVIATSRRKSDLLGYNNFVRFVARDLADVDFATLYQEQFRNDHSAQDAPRPHCVVALHACDIATDLALAFAMGCGSDVIAVAPCCHAELAALWKNNPDTHHPLSPVFRSPNLRRETAAHLTDALRMLLLRSKGYEVTPTEFVPSEHTPKNRLLLGVRRGSWHEESTEQFKKLREYIGNHEITLERLLRSGPEDAAPSGP